MANKSIIEDDRIDVCYLCGTEGHTDEHHIFGGPCRSTSDRYGLVVHLCRDCHRDLHDRGGMSMDYLHKIGQRAYEERFGNRKAFINKFIRSYL